jgi:hypothetical protein
MNYYKRGACSHSEQSDLLEVVNPLEDAIEECAKFGYELFSHLSGLRFRRNLAKLKVCL